MPKRRGYKYFDVYVFGKIASRKDSLQPCKVDLGSQLDSVQIIVAPESSGFSIQSLTCWRKVCCPEGVTDKNWSKGVEFKIAL